MKYRKISAHYVFPGNSHALKYGIVEFDAEGIIKQLIDTGGEYQELAGLEFYSGILTPAFIVPPLSNNFFNHKTEIPDIFFNFKEVAPKNRIIEDTVKMQEILKYLIMIKKYNPEISLEEQISLISYKAACTLKIDKEYGSIEAGKKPGINLLTQLDLQKFLITGQTKVIKII